MKNINRLKFLLFISLGYAVSCNAQTNIEPGELTCVSDSYQYSFDTNVNQSINAMLTQKLDAQLLEIKRELIQQTLNLK